jgi:Lysozyme inhibitor LprI
MIFKAWYFRVVSHTLFAIFLIGSGTLLAQSSQRSLAADKELNQVYQQLIKAGDAPYKNHLRTIQRDWIKQRDAAVARSQDKDDAFYKTTESRIKELRLDLLLLRNDQVFTSLKQPFSGNPSHWLSRITNGPCAVPNLDEGYHIVQLVHGSYTCTKEDDKEEVSIGRVVTGSVENHSAAVAILTDWTGGSGIFIHLILYFQYGDFAYPIGQYPVGDRSKIESLSIKRGKIFLKFKDRGESKSQKKILSLSDFELIDLPAEKFFK